MREQRMPDIFRETPAGFHRRMKTTLHALETGQMNREEQKMRRTSARGLLIACVLAIVLIGTAFAATRGFGLLDMLSERLPTNEQMQDMIQTVVERPARQKDYKVKIEQAICDGIQAYFTARVSPTDPNKTLLIDAGRDMFR